MNAVLGYIAHIKMNTGFRMLLALDPPEFHFDRASNAVLDETSSAQLQHFSKLFYYRRSALCYGHLCADCDIVCLLNFLRTSFWLLKSTQESVVFFYNSSKSIQNLSKVANSDIQRNQVRNFRKHTYYEIFLMLKYYKEQMNLNLVCI